MTMGNFLDGTDQQYVALKDDNGTWRVLDSWHDDIKVMSADDDIPDDSSAVQVLSEGQFIALMKEAGRLGVLHNATFGTGAGELENVILEKDQEIQSLNDQIIQLKDQKSEVLRDVEHTEDYQLKEKAMENILKLVSMQDMSNLSRE